jgi:HK97 family phage portal protein
MNLLTRIASAFTREPRVFPGLNTRSAALVVPEWQRNKPQWLPTDPATLELEGYDKEVVVFACVNVLGNAIASAPLRLVENIGPGDQAPIPPSPSSSPGRLATLIDNPSPYDSQPEFIEQVVKIAAVTGICVYEKFRAPAGNVISLHPLRTDWLYPIPRNAQEFDWEYRIPGIKPPPILKAENVGVFRFNSAVNMGPMGTPPLLAAMRQVGISNQMTDFTKLFFERDGTPSWIAILKDEYANASQAEADTIKEQMRQRFGGGRGVGQIGVLPALDRLERVSLDYNEMAFVDLNKMTASAICSAFGVHPILVHTQLGIDASTYSNYGQARRAFYEDTIVPLWRRLDGSMTRALLSDFDVPPTVTLEFDTSDVPALQDDLTNERAQKIELWKAQVITRNELRTDFGYKEIADANGKALPFGEEFYAPANPFAGMLSDGGEDEDEERTWAGMRVIQAPPSRKYALSDAQIKAAWQHTAISAPAFDWSVKTAPTHEPRMVRLPPETRARVATTAREDYDALAASGAPALRRFWKEQGERVVSQAVRSAWWVHNEGFTVAHSLDPNGDAEFRNQHVLARLGVHPESRDIAQIDWDDEADLLREVLAALHQKAARRGWLAAADMGIPASAYDVANPYVQGVLADVGTRIDGISETTQADVRRVVGDGLDEGVTMEELAERLTDLFEETYKGRAMTVARSESQVAYNLGTVAAGKASGVSEFAELMDNAEHTDDYGASDGLSCAQRNGLIVPLDQVSRHVEAEHPNGQLAVALVVTEIEE